MGVVILTAEVKTALCNLVLRAGPLDGPNPPDIGVQCPELNGTKQGLDERTSPSGLRSY